MDERAVAGVQLNEEGWCVWCWKLALLEVGREPVPDVTEAEPEVREGLCDVLRLPNTSLCFQMCFMSLSSNSLQSGMMFSRE